MRSKLQILKEKYKNSEIDYDTVYDYIEGWIAYAKNANTCKLRKKILTDFESDFPNEISTKEINRHLKIQKRENYASFPAEHLLLSRIPAAGAASAGAGHR